MKDTDLQIGDYVYLPDDIYLKVEQITKRKVGYHTKNNECKMHYERLCNIYPIPITPEILEKNGFKRWKFTSLYQYYGKDINIGYSFDTLACGIYKYCECNLEFKKDFKYVHELQHALILCGIDKEIVL